MELDTAERLGVAGEGYLVAGRPVDVVEDRARGPAEGEFAQVSDIGSPGEATKSCTAWAGPAPEQGSKGAPTGQVPIDHGATVVNPNQTCAE